MAELDEAFRAVERLQSDLEEESETVSNLEEADEEDWEAVDETYRRAEEEIRTVANIERTLPRDVRAWAFREQAEERTDAFDEFVTGAEPAMEGIEAVRTLLAGAKPRAGELPPEADRDIPRIKEKHEGAKRDVESLATVKDAIAEQKETIAARKPEETDWIAKIKDSIPVEILAVWTFVSGIADANVEPVSSATATLGGVAPAPTSAGGLPTTWYWAVFVLVLVATGLHVYQDILIGPASALETARTVARSVTPSTPKNPVGETGSRLWSKWTVRVQILIALLAFTVWVYYLGGPFEAAGLYNEAMAAILLPLVIVAGPSLLNIWVKILVDAEKWLRGLRTRADRSSDQY